MNENTKKKIAIIIFVVAIITALIAALMWMIPVSGFFIYPFVCGFAVLLNVVSWVLAKGHKVLRLTNCVMALFLILSIIADVILLVGFMTGF